MKMKIFETPLEDRKIVWYISSIREDGYFYGISASRYNSLYDEAKIFFVRDIGDDDYYSVLPEFHLFKRYESIQPIVHR